MFASFVDRIRSETQVDVPRRFSIGSLFVLLTMYGVLFRLLVWIGTDTRWTGATGLFFVAVMVGQMLLFHGVRPRAASMVTGALTCPAMLLVVVIDEMFTKRIGWQPLDGALRGPQTFLAAMVLLAIVGLALGYLAGGAMAGVFYLIGKVRPSSSIAGVTDAALAESHASRFSVCVGSMGRWINPIQPRSPWRGALAAFLIPVGLGFLLSPFIDSATLYHVMVLSTGLGAALALWSGNLQVRFYWPMVLCWVVASAAAWLAAALAEFPMVQDVFGEQPKILPVSASILGILIGLTVSALVGWSRWVIYRSRDNGRFGKTLLGMSVVLLFGLAWLAKARLDAWVQSPRQQLFKEVRAGGGYIGWVSDWSDIFDVSGQTLYGVGLSENTDDEDFLKLLPSLSGLCDVSLTGKGFTNRSVAALEGMQLGGLTLNGTSMTDEAFSELTDFSAYSAHLPMNDVGDEAVARLTAIARIQGLLGDLSLDNTKITDEVFLSLKACRSLTRLSLSQCGISDGGLKMLVKAVPKLRHLDLEGTDITDEGLAHLAKVKGLRNLNVTNTDVTRAGIDRLFLALPRCLVSWSDSTDEIMEQSK